MDYITHSDFHSLLGGMIPGDDSFFLHPMYEQFCGKECHAIQTKGAWVMEKLLQSLGPHLIRSEKFQTKTAPAYRTQNEDYERLLFRPAQDVFVLSEVDHLTVVGPTRSATQELMDRLVRDCCAPTPDGCTPAPVQPRFGILTFYSDFEVKEVELSALHIMDDAELSLHYGEDFPEWEHGFVTQLSKRDSGLSILRGEPGTGKTMFLRHLMAKLHATHCFYYLPASYSHLLSNPDMVRFWHAQQAEGAQRRRVVVLDNAVELLHAGKNDDRSRVASFLDAADGLLSDFLKIQILCTLNCPLDAIDPALLTAGRLLACREFRRLTQAQAVRLAQAKGLPPPPPPDYSLAEIYLPPASIGEIRAPQSPSLRPESHRHE